MYTMRSRSRYSPLADHEVKHLGDAAPPNESHFVWGSGYESTETIKDLGNDGSTSQWHRSRMKPCLHTRFEEWQAPIYPSTSDWYVSNPNYWTRNTAMPWKQFLVGVYHTSWQYFGHPLSLENVPTLSDVSGDVQAQAIRSMLPKVNDGLSLVNFLLELKDVKKLFDMQLLEKYLNLTSRRELTRQLRDGARNRARRKANGGVNDEDIPTLDDITGDFLNFNFGWKPFVADLSAAMKALNSMDKRLRYLEQNANRPVKRHSVHILDVPPLPGDIDHDEFGTINGMFQFPIWGSSFPYPSISRRTRYVYAPRYHATMVYNYTLPNVSPFRRKLRAYLDAFGVRFNPAIIWNAIPFSFVIDWFLSVSDFLNSFTPNDLGMHVTILDFSHSVKYHWICEIDGHMPDKPPNTSDVTRPIMVIQGRRYERECPIPDLHAISASWPSLMPFLLGGTLYHNQTSRRPRKFNRRG